MNVFKVAIGHNFKISCQISIMTLVFSDDGYAHQMQRKGIETCCRRWYAAGSILEWCSHKKDM